jgi:hypothetical protein
LYQDEGGSRLYQDEEGSRLYKHEMEEGGREVLAGLLK